jgi:hypothetical protein
MALSNDLSLECLICHFCIALAKYWAIQSQYTHISFYLLIFYGFLLLLLWHLQTVLSVISNAVSIFLFFQRMVREVRFLFHGRFGDQEVRNIFDHVEWDRESHLSLLHCFSEVLSNTESIHTHIILSVNFFFYLIVPI